MFSKWLVPQLQQVGIKVTVVLLFDGTPQQDLAQVVD
jgi:hypothetical protein